MIEIQYLRMQAARAERLARATMDSLTIERLQSMSQDYQRQADQLAACFRQAPQQPNHAGA